MKKTLFFLLIFLFLTNCKETKREKLSEPKKDKKTTIKFNKKTKKRHIKRIDTVGKYKKSNQVKRKKSNKKNRVIKSQYVNEYSTLFSFNHHKLKDYLDLNLSFTPIDKSKFRIYKEQYDNKIIKNFDNIKDGLIELTVSDSVHKFITKSKGDLDLHHDYFGYLEPINSYIIGVKGKGIYDTYLLDKEKGLIFGAEIFDFNDNIPLISPNNKRIIFYATSIFEGSSYIAVCNRNDKKTLESIYDCYYKIIKWKIDGLIWIDDNTFAFRVYDKVEYKKNNGKRVKKLINERYLKAKIIE